MWRIDGLRGNGGWRAARAGNFLDGSAYYYTTYRCADGGWVAVGAIEPAFRRALFAGLGLSDAAESLMQARDDDPAVREKLAAIFARHPRAHWQQEFEHSDACVSPVLAIDEEIGRAHSELQSLMRNSYAVFCL